jgi:hypothetical protein
MNHDLFIVEEIFIAPKISISLLFEKNMNYRELIECYIRIKVQLEESKSFKIIKKLRYVYNDKIISFDNLMIFINQLLKEVTDTLDAIDSGINLSPDFYLKYPGLDNSDIEIRKDIKKSIGNITEYKLQPYIIKLYTILTSFKGTDTLQQRKYKKMIENQEAAILYQDMRGNK